MTLDKITATAVRFIKLGIRGRFEQDALKDNRLYLGYHETSDDACRKGEWEAVHQTFVNAGHKAFVASNHMRQVKEFYDQPDRCLWITFIDGDLWWCFADPAVTMCLEPDWQNIAPELRGPSRYRSSIGSWQNTNINGRASVSNPKLIE